MSRYLMSKEKLCKAIDTVKCTRHQDLIGGFIVLNGEIKERLCISNHNLTPEDCRLLRDGLAQWATGLSTVFSGVLLHSQRILEKNTIMRPAAMLINKFYAHLHCLSIQGPLIRKAANALLLSPQVVAKVVRSVCKAINLQLDTKKYIKFSSVELEVETLVRKFHQTHGIGSLVLGSH